MVSLTWWGPTELMPCACSSCSMSCSTRGASFSDITVLAVDLQSAVPAFALDFCALTLVPPSAQQNSSYSFQHLVEGEDGVCKARAAVTLIVQRPGGLQRAKGIR